MSSLFKISLLFIVSIILNLNELYAQNLTDTLRARQYFQSGDSLRKANQLDSAKLYYERSNSIYENVGDWEKVASSLTGLISILFQQQRLNEADSLVDRVINICHTYLEDDHSRYAEILITKGKIIFKAGDYDIALEYHRKALETLLLSKDDEPDIIADAYDNMGICMNSLGQYDSAKIFTIKSLKMREESGKDTRELAISYQSLGNIYYAQGDYDQTLEYWEKALNTIEKVFSKDHLSITSYLNNLAVLYLTKKYYEKGTDVLLRSLKIRQKHLREDHPSLGLIYFNLSSAYQGLGQFDLSLEYQKKSSYIFEKNYGKRHPYIESTYNNIATDYSRIKNFEKSLEYFNKSLALGRELRGEKDSRLGITYQNIGNVYDDMKEYELSLKYLRKSVNIFKITGRREISKSYGLIAGIYINKNNYDSGLFYLKKQLEEERKYDKDIGQSIAIAYNSIGMLFRIKGEFIKSLEFQQKAINANVIGYNDSSIYSIPPLKGVIFDKLLLQTLGAKSLAFEQLYYESRNVKDLKYALKTLNVSERLADMIRFARIRYTDRVEFGHWLEGIYNGGVRVSHKLFKITGNSDYKEKALFFAEKSKAYLLALNLSAQTAKKFSGVPESVIKLEKRLKTDQTYYKSELLYLKTSKEEGQSTEKIKLLEDKLFKTNLSLDSLVLTLEKENKDYYDLKYKRGMLDSQEIQQQLTANQALLEYYESDSSSYLFVISKTDFEIFKIENDSSYLNGIEDYKTSFDGAAILSEYEKNFKQFCSSSYNLYHKILEAPLKLLSGDINHLIIISDGELSYVPWDVLIKKEPLTDDKELSYRKLDYLFNDYSISYAYSANLFVDGGLRKPKKNSSQILAFAPKYNVNPDDVANSALPQLFRNEFRPLKWNGDELNNVSRHFEGKYLKDSLASESIFKSQASDYQVLHLAMHAFVDNENPMLSKLMFSQNNDSIEDGMLHVYELYNMDFSAEMAVLSACNTGIGNLQRGEGMMSLARAFAYAGCPSIIMSHWPVDDESTSIFMNYFYEALAEGKSKSVAMQEAKKLFLDNTESELKTHPFYWGSFTVLGDTSPLSNRTSSWPYWLMAFAGILVALLFVLRKRARPL